MVGLGGIAPLKYASHLYGVKTAAPACGQAGEQLVPSLNPGGPSENRTRVPAMRMPCLTTGP